MEHTSEEIQQKLGLFQKVLKQARIKLTPQRIEIFREVIHFKDHTDAVTLFKSIRDKIPPISLDTVYRTS